ncbi:enoyl-CoA hydratase/isomerase family protein [Streptomyces sp. NBC_00158]|uniref:enoyl-CoA hydratase/isomerase family protein n=1 Tax=Streptomyces sp. NBC_00158 TaxID=2903627 RepID=UPI00324479B7
MADVTDDTVLIETDGCTGLITLNRPRALNALTHSMVLRIGEALTAWEHDPAVSQVLLRGAGDRGLCAGGDIRAIHADAKAGTTGSLDFWRDEYRLNARIARYPKPYVALMDGIVMGGGVGLSAHGGVRVVTERSKVAMPETGIGFVPDVGGTYLLSRAPGELGTHLALTGTAVGAGDALLCGLADHYLPSDWLEEFTRELTLAPVAEVLPEFRGATAPEAPLAAEREWIDHCYAADTVEEIHKRLLGAGPAAAREASQLLHAKSPTSLKVTLAALRRARELDSLERVLEQEYRVSAAALSTPDLVEGIRAQVIDKDRRPRWSPAALFQVRQASVDRHFAPLGEDRELTFPQSGAGRG